MIKHQITSDTTIDGCSNCDQLHDPTVCCHCRDQHDPDNCCQCGHFHAAGTGHPMAACGDYRCCIN